MSLSCRFERSLINREEYEVIRITHHPAIYEVEREGLQAARNHLRSLQEKERTFARQNRRTARGKAESRGGSFPGTHEGPTRRKQVFASAVKRISKELDRRTKIEARTSNVEAARKALALRRTANFSARPAAGDTANPGMQALISAKRRNVVTGKRIGSISQAVRASQARSDNR
jgi:hypothetical protein